MSRRTHFAVSSSSSEEETNQETPVSMYAPSEDAPSSSQPPRRGRRKHTAGRRREGTRQHSPEIENSPSPQPSPIRQRAPSYSPHHTQQNPPSPPPNPPPSTSSVPGLRDISPPYALDEEYFRLNSLPVMDYLDGAHIFPFISNSEPCFYPDLIREFYRGLSWNNQTRALSSRVQGRIIRMTMPRFCEIAGLVDEGMDIYVNGVPDTTGYTPDGVMNLICHVNANVRGRLLVGSLTVFARLIHIIIVRIL